MPAIGLRHPALRTCARVFATVVLIEVGLVIHESKPAAAASNFRVYDHNVQGYYTNAALDMAANDPPLMFTLQEVCKSTYVNLEATLRYRGYLVGLSQPSSLRSEVCDGGPGGYNVVATKGAPLSYGPIGGYFGHQDQSDTGEQSWVCFSATYGYSWWVCSSHLHASSPLYATAQSEEMRTIALGDYLAGRAVIVGMDSNRTPYQTGAYEWYGSFYEADQTRDNRGLPTYRNHVDLSKKIDHIYSLKLVTTAGLRGRSDQMQHHL